MVARRRYAYLGPAGTFTEAALLSVPGARDSELVPVDSVTAALAAVRSGDADAAMVPLENSVEGSVNATLDELAVGQPLVIVREVLVPVVLCLVARAGTALSDVRVVATHPHAEAQSRSWLATHVPQARYVAAPSTASAAAAVAEGGGPDAAVSAPVAAEHYGLSVLASGIGDNSDAVTRFVLVARPGRLPPPTGRDKSSLVAFMGDDHPGALLEILEQFAVRRVNLTRIESRPTGEGIGSYHFSIDCEGHVADARVAEALMGLRRMCADVRFLGSYERADGVPNTVGPGTTDADFRAAEAWLRSLLDAGDGASAVGPGA